MRGRSGVLPLELSEPRWMASGGVLLLVSWSLGLAARGAVDGLGAFPFDQITEAPEPGAHAAGDVMHDHRRFRKTEVRFLQPAIQRSYGDVVASRYAACLDLNVRINGFRIARWRAR